MYKKKIAFLILIIFSISCTTFPFKNYYHDDNGIPKPKKPKFKLAKHPYQLKKEDLIDINSVYTYTYTLEGKGTNILAESYLRFFNNGRYYLNVKINPKKANPTYYNDVSSCFIGYYKIDNIDKLTIEFFRIHDNGRYVKRYGYIRNDSIFMYKSSYKKNGFPKPNENNCQIYVRKKVTGLTGEASW